MVAGAAMAFSSVSVVTNALLLRQWRPAGAAQPAPRATGAARAEAETYRQAA
jgi:Cu+-exporting ATPase